MKLQILLILATIAALYLAFDRGQDSFFWQRGFEEMRGELESFHRTTGRGVDPAFICREK
jgi:hypothetical protein